MIFRKRLHMLLWILTLSALADENVRIGNSNTDDFENASKFDYSDYTLFTKEHSLEFDDNSIMRETTNSAKDSSDEEQFATQTSYYKETTLGPVNDVEGLTAKDFGIDWIFLSWNYSYSKKESNVSFIIKQYDEEDPNNVKEVIVNDIYYNATDLEPCSEYVFTIVTKIDHRTSNGVNLTVSTDRNITEIGEVRDFRANNADFDRIMLTWERPKKYSKCISSYCITRCLDGICEEIYNVPASADSYEVTKLNPCTQYNFDIKVFASENMIASQGVNCTARTNSPALSEPRSPKAETGNFSLNIHWEPPELGTVCLKLYRVTLHPNAFTVSTTNTSVTISNLNACTLYTVYITAVNQDNGDGVMATITGTTAPAVSNPPISKYGEIEVSKKSISVNWLIKTEGNRCQNLSVTMWCNYTGSNGYGYDLVNGESTVLLKPVAVTSSHLYVNVTVKELSPFTMYDCWAIATNVAGNSNKSNVINTITAEDVPSAPILRVTDVSDSRFILRWDRPDYLAGILKIFEIQLYWKHLYSIPDWCGSEAMSASFYVNVTEEEDTFVLDFPQGKPFSNYSAAIRAASNAGWGMYCDVLTFQTKSAAPGPVSNISYVFLTQNSSDPTGITLSWGIPCSSNGILETFNVSVYGVKDGEKPHYFYIETNGTTADTEQNDYRWVTLEELKREYNYTFGVSAKNIDVQEFGTMIFRDGILFPSGIPPQPDEEYRKSITIDPYKARRSTSSAALLLPLFPDTNGDVKYYAIMVAEMGHNIAQQEKFDLKSNTWPDIPSWEEAMLKDFSIPYQATRPRWNPYPNHVADYGHIKAVEYTLGEDGTCKEISSNTDKRLYCNGPLKPDTWYHVRMRAFTYGGYADSEAFLIKTNAELNVAAVIGIVFGILFLGILTTMMLLVRKCSPQVVLRHCLHSNIPGSPVPAPFTRKKFIAHCQQLADNPGKLSNEFRLLQTLSVDLQMPTNTACLQANRKKNRYSDILPYDFSRVKLEVVEDDPNTDYINASFIRGYSGEDEYIACQGPKEETTYDFWRMIDQYDVKIIIMLTQLVEKGKEKCHQYFPAIRETFSYENMTIRCTSELDFQTYTQRTIVLQKEDKRRNITHLHFKDWPDHDVPEDFDPMINFCQRVRRNIVANKGFVVIHCSAGIGRTGTLIAIDILLQHLRDNRKLDVFGTVYRLRHHRINMVQREAQYAYIYNCIKQVVQNPYFLKTYKPPPVNPEHINMPRKTDESSNSSINLVSDLET